MKLRVLKSMDGCQVHYADADLLVYSTGMKLTAVSSDGGASLETDLRRADITSSVVDSLSVAARLLRRGIHSARRSRHDRASLIVQLDNRLMVVPMDGKSGQIELHRMPNGRRVLRRGWCETEQGEILVGEYWSNPDREPVRIFAVVDGRHREVHTFLSGEIRHIHALEYDPFDGGVWFTTGDRDDECLIGRLDEEFSLARIVGQGAQRWRAVSLAFYADAVYWGSDNHDGANSIWRFDRSSREITKQGEVVGPVYYNVTLPNHIVFSTAMEKGEGSQDGFARLYALDLASGRIEEIRRERKDRLSPKWFGYGLFEFAEGSLGDNRFWVSAKGLDGGLWSELVELTG